MQPTTETREGREYTLRPYEPADRDGYLSLYERVEGERHSPEWFEWRFLDNPYVDDVPMFVIESGGAVVATRPFFVLRMHVGESPRLALRTVDTMVHPDHRRLGLFSWMTREAVEEFTQREPEFVFTRPAGVARTGFLELGWRELDSTGTYYRIQDPSSLLTARRGGAAVGRLAGLASPLVRGYNFAKGRSDVASERFSIDVSEGVPTRRLAALYDRTVPDAAHAVRDETYYRWRFASPEWNRRTYVAGRAGRPMAGILTRSRRTRDAVTVTQLADLVPLAGDEQWRSAIGALVSRIIDDHRESALLAAPERVFPEAVMTAFGFRSDGVPPLSWFRENDTRLLARPLTADGEWAFDGCSLPVPCDWLLSYGERDTT